MARPILRYHGGKWLLAPWIIRHFPKHKVYVEPFGGGASVLLRKQRSYAEIYNDLDGEVVNLFLVVRNRGPELVEKLRLTPFARDEYRASFEASEDPVEQARRTVVRSLMGFGSNALCREIQSGFRSNANRSGTTPAHDWPSYQKALSTTIGREVSPKVYDEIRGKLEAAGYIDQFHGEGQEEVIDMHGIALKKTGK